MSVDAILRKLLILFYAPVGLRTKILRTDIRATIAKEETGTSSSGGDFHGPFWADAKTHALGLGDLDTLTALRIDANSGRERLYPMLAEGFLVWWNNRRRWRNEPLNVLPGPPKAQLIVAGGVVKIDNIMALESGGDFQRLIYPYFAEIPTLPPEGGRLGLWAMGTALPAYDLADMRILDVLRSTTFATVDHPLTGDEQQIFLHRYEHLRAEWQQLRDEYP